MTGFSLRRGPDRGDAIDLLAARLGGRVRVDGLLGDLSRRARRTWAPGLAVRGAWTWDDVDRRDPTWWPQGISTSADADPSERVAGRRLVATTWYSKAGQGSRVTVLDLDARRYEHVLLVQADPAGGDVSPVGVHAGGLLWCGPWLHVAATARGFWTFRLDDLLRVPDRVDGPLTTYGHRYLLPARMSYAAGTDPGVEPLRYSFLGLDREGPTLTVGEYGGEDGTRRLTRWPLGPDLLPAVGEDGTVRPLSVQEGVMSMQGAVRTGGRWHLSTSHGRRRPGTLVTGGPGSWRRRRWAMPMGPEDLSWWPSTDRLWTVTEYPPRRWVVTLRRPR